MAETVKYCRREVGDETPPKFCMKPITHANVLDWCGDCRAARVPMWPADGAVEALAKPAPLAVEAETLTLDALEANENA